MPRMNHLCTKFLKQCQKKVHKQFSVEQLFHWEVTVIKAAVEMRMAECILTQSISPHMGHGDLCFVVCPGLGNILSWKHYILCLSSDQ
jgi:hypothetical protein